jgi:hypothetical protein
MRHFAMTVAIAAIAAISSGAFAQNTGQQPPTPQPDAPRTTGQAPKAPIGHRQPAAKDLPPELNEKLGPSPEDRKLDQKLTICRGC